MIAIAATVLLLALLPWMQPFSLGHVGLALWLAAVFGSPVYFVVGLPYLAFGYPGWGFEQPILFIIGGAFFGAVGATGYGMVLMMPESVPSFFPLGGTVAGTSSAAVWHAVARLQQGKPSG